MPNQNNKNLRRSPVVVVVGHVDHGKTSLLDYIRKTTVAAKEAGAITQSIGAYEITHTPQTDAERTQNDAEKSLRSSALSQRTSAERITFIDTPGHEAFSKMRARGAKVADVAILVVAAEEGVKPQTKEAIQVLQSSKTPFIVAITKIDKPSADLERVKKDLAAHNVFVEGYGGDVSYQGVSSKTGEGVKELLDLILLAAEMEDLAYNPEGLAKGFILESRLDPRRGITTSLIIKDGKLKTGDDIVTATARGKVKILENFFGKKVPELSPSSPAIVLGFENPSQPGEEFQAGKLTAEELEAVKKISSANKFISAEAGNELTARIILKADVSGSLEALNEVLKKIPLGENQKLEILYQAVGEITDGDVKDAVATGAVIVGFGVYPNKAAESLARAQNIIIITHNVIYKLAEELEKVLRIVAKKETGAELEILALFSSQGQKQTIGGRVNRGAIKNKERLEIRREEKTLGQGKILNLQHKKMDVNVVNAGNECGLVIESNIKIEVGDKLIANS